MKTLALIVLFVTLPVLLTAAMIVSVFSDRGAKWLAKIA